MGVSSFGKYLYLMITYSECAGGIGKSIGAALHGLIIELLEWRAEREK